MFGRMSEKFAYNLLFHKAGLEAERRWEKFEFATKNNPMTCFFVEEYLLVGVVFDNPQLSKKRHLRKKIH